MLFFLWCQSYLARSKKRIPFGLLENTASSNVSCTSAFCKTRNFNSQLLANKIAKPDKKTVNGLELMLQAKASMHCDSNFEYLTANFKQSQQQQKKTEGKSDFQLCWSNIFLLYAEIPKKYIMLTSKILNHAMLDHNCCYSGYN